MLNSPKGVLLFAEQEHRPYSNSRGRFKIGSFYSCGSFLGEGKQELWWKKSKVGVCDHFEPSVSFETWQKAVSSNIRPKPYANFFVKHSSEEKSSFEV